MSKHRRAAKVDSNQAEIVEKLRKMSGVTVSTGKDDILVGYKGMTFWYEIKTGPTAEVKESQKKLAENWKGHYKIVWSAEQIMDDMVNSYMYRPYVNLQ